MRKTSANGVAGSIPPTPMTSCPRCHTDAARVVRSRGNAARLCVSVILLPFYVLGGLAGDDRGPLLPLERRCRACGYSFRRRSVVDEVRSWASSDRPGRS